MFEGGELALSDRLTIQEALLAYSRESAIPRIEGAERERQSILERFPLHAWPSMSLEDYALGQDDSKDTFCRWVEFRSENLGGIRGGSSRKLLVFKYRDKPGWYFNSGYMNEQHAWTEIRNGFVRALELAQAGEFDRIDEISELRGGPALLLKVLHVYFPDQIVPVYSKAHVEHFLSLLQGLSPEQKALGVVSLNRILWKVLREIPEINGWTTVEIMRLLYFWADPRESSQIFKIAPGEDAVYWDECLQGGYICVGWDNVGDLGLYQSKQDFRKAFDIKYSERYNGNKSKLGKKANEIWTLRELQPGDVIVANSGTSKILAIGEVVEPGYEWSAARSEFKHIVHVRWDVSYAQDIEIQKHWAFVTVDKVSPALYQLLLQSKATTPILHPQPPLEPLFREIEDALERKGQVILYGPPGTGKTYQARRFAVWWLSKHEQDPLAGVVLGNKNAFLSAERRLSASQVVNRVWWVVANVKEWNWKLLFQQGKVEFRYGRLKRNYPLVQPGDFVVGYQAAPDKKIIALARISRGLEVVGDGEPTIELEHIAQVSNGLTYDELLADPIMKDSEPLRFRNQGTLFSLSTGEASHLFARLTERNPELQEKIDSEESIAALTSLTFHPSYSYEDFVEGFKPAESSNGGLVLRLEDGVFKRVCREAQANPKKRYLLLIDEINRANVAKVFGELITLLEKDKRNLVVTLPQSKETFSIPSNLYLLGTMNTADRSIKLLDTALRRRFAFLELMPDIELLRGNQIGALRLDDFLEKLNRRIVAKEGREKQIGHSFLLDNGIPVDEAEEFARRFRQEIVPLLQEFCYDDYSALAEYLGEGLIDAEAQTVNKSILEDADLLIDSLEDEFIRSGDES